MLDLHYISTYMMGKVQNVQEFKKHNTCTNIHMYKHTHVQAYTCTSIHMYKHTHVQTYTCTSMSSESCVHEIAICAQACLQKSLNLCMNTRMYDMVQ